MQYSHPHHPTQLRQDLHYFVRVDLVQETEKEPTGRGDTGGGRQNWRNTPQRLDCGVKAVPLGTFADGLMGFQSVNNAREEVDRRPWMRRT